MGVLLRLVVTAATVAGLVYANDAVKSWPVNEDVVALNDWINSLLLPSAVIEYLSGFSRILVTYTRNVIAGTLMYHTVAGLWSLYIYVIQKKHFFPDTSKVRCVGCECAVDVVAGATTASLAPSPGTFPLTQGRYA